MRCLRVCAVTPFSTLVPKMSEVAFVLLAAFSLRAAIGLSGYSGEGVPPMFGDFEAQRHWMEVTVNLPPTQWYVHGPDNDLQYWGLDYPPLSAHVSWLIGNIARAIGMPELVALHASRGIETASTRAFMRNSVLALDALVFLPAAVIAAGLHGSSKTGTWFRCALLVQLTCNPSLLLVDHGHFQYNCVSLGLTLWGIVAALSGYPLASSVAFSLALNFKQMSLYLAPAFFTYLLAGCLRRSPSLADKALAVARLGLTVIATFTMCWLPFLGEASDVSAVLKRIFPVERHLYEDKVANLWCTLSLLPHFKLKALLSIPSLLRLSLCATLVALLPPCGLLLARPSRLGFLLCATACGLGFFLCSFQVHEKHILLPLLPASLLAERHPLLFGWSSTVTDLTLTLTLEPKPEQTPSLTATAILTLTHALRQVATFSLYPLLKRDGLALPYAVCQLGYLAFSCGLQARVVRVPERPASLRAARGRASPIQIAQRYSHMAVAASYVYAWPKLFPAASQPSSLYSVPSPHPCRTLTAPAPWRSRRPRCFGMALLHLLEAIVAPPPRYPDLYAVAFAAYSCVHFAAAYLGLILWQWQASMQEPEHTPMDTGSLAEVARRSQPLVVRYSMRARQEKQL